MRRRTLVLSVALALWSLVGAAQTTHYVQWDPNPATEQVTQYTLVYDATSGQTVAPTVDPTCACIQAPVSVTAGSHTVSVTATNQWGTSAATTLTFNANPAGKVVNIRIK